MRAAIAAALRRQAKRLLGLADVIEADKPLPRYTRPPVPRNTMFRGLREARYVPWNDRPRMHWDPRDYDLFADYDEEEMFYGPEF
jgi:hypothetical protein